MRDPQAFVMAQLFDENQLYLAILGELTKYRLQNMVVLQNYVFGSYSH